MAWLRITRIGNALIAGIASAIGAWIIQPEADWVLYLLVSAAPILITAAGNIQNDLQDIAIDRLSHPDRPLVTGQITPGASRIVFWILSILGVGSAVLLTTPAVVISVVVLLGLSLYNYRLSNSSIWGNLMIAILGALPILYGALSAGAKPDSRGFIVLTFAAIAFWLHFARELLKDVLDMEGDTLSGRLTYPLARGPRAAMRLAALAMLCAAATSPWPTLNGWLGAIYLVGVCATVIPALLLGAGQCWWREEESLATTWSAGLKLCMLAGLLWIILGVAQMPKP